MPLEILDYVECIAHHLMIISAGMRLILDKDVKLSGLRVHPTVINTSIWWKN